MKEIDIVRNQFKEYHLVHVSEKGEFFFVKNNETLAEVPIDYRDKTAFDKFNKVRFGKDDLEVEVKVWDDDTYTVFCANLDGKLQPLK